MPKEPKKKKIPYVLLRPADWPDMHALLNDLIESVHDHLTNARIALAWHVALKADVDGRLVLGKAKKCSDLDRELAPYDFVIILNSDFWNDKRTSDAQRRALMDHELSHCEVALDEDGDPKRDEKDRVVYRIRKHDIEEFVGVVQRNGIYKGDIQAFAESLREAKKPKGLFEEPEHSGAAVTIAESLADLAPRRGSGIDSVSITGPDGHTTTLTADDGDRLRKHARELRAEARH